MKTKKELPHYKQIEAFEKDVEKHNIFDDKLRERLWNEMNDYVDHLQYKIDEMPYYLRKHCINHIYIKRLEECQDCVL